MKQLAIALEAYASDHDGRLPTKFKANADLREALRRYVQSEEVFSTRNEAGGEIVPNSQLAGLAVDAIALPDHTALLYETKVWEEGCTMYGFVSGRVRCVRDTSLVVMEPVLIVIPLVDTIDVPHGPPREEQRPQD
ncbi:MAG: hypothetical protein WD716_01220 [Fimbriimonadaceae bacterium]